MNFENWRPKRDWLGLAIQLMPWREIYLETKLDKQNLYLPTIILIQRSLTWKRCQFVFNQNNFFSVSCWFLFTFTLHHRFDESAEVGVGHEPIFNVPFGSQLSIDFPLFRTIIKAFLTDQTKPFPKTYVSFHEHWCPLNT